MRHVKVGILFVICGLISSDGARAQSTAQQKIRGLAMQQVLTFCPQCEITIENKWIPDDIIRMDSAYIKKIQFEEVGLPKGYQKVDVLFVKHGNSQARQVQLFIELKQKLPVVNKRIKRNQTITAGDIAWKLKDITRMPKFPLASADEIVGQSAHRMILKGNMVLDSDLQQVPVITVGDQVQMLYQKGGIELALECTARQAKAMGERIHVYSQETRKIYIAKVQTPSKVIWEKTL